MNKSIVFFCVLTSILLTSSFGGFVGITSGTDGKLDDLKGVWNFSFEASEGDLIAGSMEIKSFGEFRVECRINYKVSDSMVEDVLFIGFDHFKDEYRLAFIPSNSIVEVFMLGKAKSNGAIEFKDGDRMVTLERIGKSVLQFDSFGVRENIANVPKILFTRK